MLFNSWSYLLFLILGVFSFYSIKTRFKRKILLLLLSLFFYSMWRWEFSFLMLFSAFLDYFLANKISASKNKKINKIYLLISLSTNLGLLLFFKYTYFFVDNFNFIASWLSFNSINLSFKIILPLGISFYTFQTISYTIDVYRGVNRPINNIISYLIYVTFWPQLIAGPILRVSEVLPQLEQKSKLQILNLKNGMERILFGLFKKVILADGISPLVDNVFAFTPESLCSWDILVGTFLFGFQIYFDFSGYSDIAIGSARLLGIKFPENFNWPYLAKSPKSFWKRWHISLSSWIRDYLYLPMAGVSYKNGSKGGIEVAKNKSNSRFLYSLFFTWLIMGFWHGAKWTFVIWGVYHAIIIFFHRKFKIFKLIEVKYSFISWCFFFPLFMVGWLPFRSNSVSDLLIYINTLLDINSYNFYLKKTPALNYYLVIALILSMVIAYGIKYLLEKSHINQYYLSIIKVFPMTIIVYLLITYLRPVSQFIYFQF